MSFWESAKLAWKLGREYSGAWSAARDAIERGASVTEIVRTFADATENQLDDRAAEQLVLGIQHGIEVAQTVAVAAGRAAAWVEKNETDTLDAIARLSSAVERHGPRVTSLVARAGVLATKAALRLDALRR